MTNLHPLRKFFGVLLLYIILIFGIFVLQFRNESTIIHFIGQLKIVLTENKDAKETIPLKNRFEIAFLGLEISANARNPAMLLTEDRSIPLALVSWEVPSPQNVELVFNNGARLSLSLDEKNERLSLFAKLPADSRLALPFKTAGGYSITERDLARTLIASKAHTYALTPGLSERQELVIHSETAPVLFAPYTESQAFSFDAAVGLTNEASFTGAVSALSSRLIEAYTAARDSGNEQTVVAYIAAMSERNRYAQALLQVPDSFKNSRNRTYLSAPYFDTLVAMDTSLTARNASLLSMLNYAVQRQGLDFFTVPNLADYLMRETNSRAVEQFLALAGTMEPFEPSVREAAGILDTYASLLTARHKYAELLESVLESCLAVVESACAIEGSQLTVYETETALAPLQIADVGAALVNYGVARNQTAIKNAGYLLLTSLCADLTQFDSRALGELYQRTARANTFYQHSTVLSETGGGKVWAWHIARSLSYEQNARGDITLTIDFPPENSHYLILKGIMPFRAIEIHQTPYRSDPRFEAYNSSGYMYNAETRTLYLKSRHREQSEIIRLIYYTPPSPPPPVRERAPEAIPIREIFPANRLFEQQPTE